MKVEAPPPRTCGRCGGSGTVSTATAADYMSEDSFPRELPVAVCDTCGGAGLVVDDGDEEDSEE